MLSTSNSFWLITIIVDKMCHLYISLVHVSTSIYTSTYTSILQQKKVELFFSPAVSSDVLVVNLLNVFV